MAYFNTLRARMGSVCSLVSSCGIVQSAVHLCKNKCWSRFVRNMVTVQSYKTGSDHKLLPAPALSYSMLSNIPQLDLIENDKNERSEEDATEILKNLSPEDARKLKVIKLEFDVLEQMNGRVPEAMTAANWLDALKLPSKHQRMKYYMFLRTKENLKKKNKMKKQLKQQEKEERDKERAEQEKITKNTIFMVIRDASISQMGNYRLANAMMYGAPLVFDMDYEQFMPQHLCKNLVIQLQYAYSENRSSKDPYHLFFTSLNTKGKVLPIMQKHLFNEHFLATVTDRSYLDLFPREKLVYLSPHAPDSLKELSDDDIYIVGGFVDKVHPKPVSFARAKAQGIRSAKLPLDIYLDWETGTKNLTLDQMMRILREQRRVKDWNESLKEVPTRKLRRKDD